MTQEQEKSPALFDDYFFSHKDFLASLVALVPKHHQTDTLHLIWEPAVEWDLIPGCGTDWQAGIGDCLANCWELKQIRINSQTAAGLPVQLIFFDQAVMGHTTCCRWPNDQNALNGKAIFTAMGVQGWPAYILATEAEFDVDGRPVKGQIVFGRMHPSAVKEDAQAS